MATIHISAAEAARDFAKLLDQVRAGVEVVIDDTTPAVRLSAMVSRPGRLLSESIALAEAHARESGREPVLGEEFAAELEEILRNRKARDTSVWD